MIITNRLAGVVQVASQGCFRYRAKTKKGSMRSLTTKNLMLTTLRLCENFFFYGEHLLLPGCATGRTHQAYGNPVSRFRIMLMLSGAPVAATEQLFLNSFCMQ